MKEGLPLPLIIDQQEKLEGTCTGDRIGSCINGDDPDVEAKATIGRASLVVDEVRFIQDETGW